MHRFRLAPAGQTALRTGNFAGFDHGIAELFAQTGEATGRVRNLAIRTGDAFAHRVFAWLHHCRF